MTHPLTQREKVRNAIIDVMKPKDADITLGRIDTCTDAILTALASGYGDHAELARLAEAATPGHWHSVGGYLTVRDPDGSFSSTIFHLDEMGQRGPDLPFQAVPFARSADAAFIAAANPATVLALLAEIAALREREKAALKECSEWARKAGEAIGRLETSEAAGIVEGWKDRVTETERKLAEAVGLLKDAASELESEVEARYDGLKDHPAMSPKYERDMDTPKRINTFLNKEAERG